MFDKIIICANNMNIGQFLFSHPFFFCRSLLSRSKLKCCLSILRSVRSFCSFQFCCHQNWLVCFCSHYSPHRFRTEHSLFSVPVLGASLDSERVCQKTRLSHFDVSHSAVVILLLLQKLITIDMSSKRY